MRGASVGLRWEERVRAGESLIADWLGLAREPLRSPSERPLSRQLRVVPQGTDTSEQEQKKAEGGRTSGGDDGPDLGQLDKDDVAERLLRVVGDADGRDVSGAVDRRPLVVRRVLVGCGVGAGRRRRG